MFIFLRVAPLLFSVLFMPAGVVWAQVVSTPSVPQPNGSQLIGANFQNPTGGTIAAGPVQFGQAFVSGDLAAGSGISATVNGSNAPAQIDVKTSHSNGSVKFGVITVMAPSLSSNSTNPTMISPAADSGTDISLSTLPGYSFVVTIAVTGSSTYTYNIPSLFAQELIAGRVSYWRQGPVVTEGRISIPIVSSMRLVVDLAKYQDGSYTTDLQVNNDQAMTAVGGQIDYSVTVVQDSVTVASYPNLQHQQYQQWRQLFTTTAVRPVNVQRDVAYLKEAGVIHQYDLGVGVSTSLIDSMANGISSNANWGKPFDGTGITKYMPGTGGRPDIGPATAWNTAWIKSQNATAAAYALGQAQAAAGIPWHFWDAGNTTWLNTTNYPNLWTDYRGGTGIPGNSSSGGLTQQVDTSLYDWTPDTAHMPALSYTPYLFTGVRFYLDQLNAEGTYSVMSFWPAGPLNGNARNYGQGLVLSPANQIRGGAWSFRELVSAAWANPDGTAEKTYFTNVVQNNLDFVNGERTARILSQGQIYGYNIGEYGSAEVLPPWQQDYLMTSMVLASQLGFGGADTYIDWATNWSVGRFLNTANGFNPRDGVNYLMVTKPAGQPLAQTWAKLAEYTAPRTNGNGWAETQGDYGQLGLAAVASIINRTGSQQAVDAYAILRALNPPFTSTSTYQSEPTFNIVPNVFVAQATPPPSATLGASSVALTVGQSTILTWSSTNATTCTGTNFTAGATAGTRTVSPTTTTYSVSCTGAGGTATTNRTVGVTPVIVTPTTPTATLTANPTQVTADQSSILTWSSTNATTCTGTNFTAGATSGTRAVTLLATTTYTVSCTGTGGTATVDRTVGVTPVVLTPSSGGGGGGSSGSGSVESSRSTSSSVESTSAQPEEVAAIITDTNKTLETRHGVWQLSTTTDSGGYEILLKNKLVRGSGALYILRNSDGKVYAINNKNIVTSWSNGRFSKVRAATARKIISSLTLPVTTSVKISGTSNAAPVILGVGSQVITLNNLNVRSAASVTSRTLGIQPSGARGTIIGGPITNGTYTWWNIDYEQSGLDGYGVSLFLAPVPAPVLITPAPVPASPVSTQAIIGSRVRTTATVNVRSTASVFGVRKGEQPQGAVGTVIDGPVSANGLQWWLINYEGSGVDGWSVGGYLVVETGAQGPGAPVVLGESTDKLAEAGKRVISTIGVTPLQKYLNPHFFTTTLQRGSTGEYVTRLQNVLITMGYLESQVTGYYGDQTASAIAVLQSTYGVPSTGVVGPETQDILNWR